MRHRYLTFAASAFCAAVSIAFAPSATSSTFTTLYEFTGGTGGSGGPNGSNPASTLIQDKAGVFYGNTSSGGATSFGGTGKCVTTVGDYLYGCGTVFSFSRTTGLKTLVIFTGPNGAYDTSSLALVGSTLYGNTYAGGTTDYGVLFSIHTDGTGFRLLHKFTGTDGSHPTSALVVGPGPALYGVTTQGGPGAVIGGPPGNGVLFKLGKDGSYTILHAFTGGDDGGAPVSLVLTKSGVLEGSTYNGGYKGRGLCQESGGCGVVFEYDLNTSSLTTIETFDKSVGTPLLGSAAPDGTVYGSVGTLFKVSPIAGFSLLRATPTGDIGIGVNVPPTLAPDGNLLSVLAQGAAYNDGTLYEQVGSVQNVLHTFDGADGADPSSPPLVTPSGTFVGTTSIGGPACNCGTIYEYTP